MTERYFRFKFGWKERNCSACNGSGYYDSLAHSPCGACEGTEKEKYKEQIFYE
jgi:DnaJ-class molecular chaperone